MGGYIGRFRLTVHGVTRVYGIGCGSCGTASIARIRVLISNYSMKLSVEIKRGSILTVAIGLHGPYHITSIDIQPKETNNNTSRQNKKEK